MHRFSEITGCKAQINGLKQAVISARVAHAYLFSGPSGVGKKTTALALAASLLCDHNQAGDACGNCASCRQVMHDNHPDLYVIIPDGASIKIEQIRDLQQKARYKSYQNKHQIFIIDPAEAMTRESANCFLKILEEPPEQTIFILISAQPDLLLPTVISRCQPMSFKELSLEEISSLLIKLAGITGEKARLAAQLAQGSIGSALSYINDDTQLKLRDLVISLAESTRRSAIPRLLQEVEDILKKKINVREMLEMLLLWYRDLLIWKFSHNEKLVFNRDKLEIIAAEAQHYTVETLVSAVEMSEKTKYNLTRNANRRAALDVLLLSLTRFGRGEH